MANNNTDFFSSISPTSVTLAELPVITDLSPPDIKEDIVKELRDKWDNEDSIEFNNFARDYIDKYQSDYNKPFPFDIEHLTTGRRVSMSYPKITADNVYRFQTMLMDEYERRNPQPREITDFQKSWKKHINKKLQGLPESEIENYVKAGRYNKSNATQRYLDTFGKAFTDTMTFGLTNKIPIDDYYGNYYQKLYPSAFYAGSALGRIIQTYIAIQTAGAIAGAIKIGGMPLPQLLATKLPGVFGKFGFLKFQLSRLKRAEPILIKGARMFEAGYWKPAWDIGKGFAGGAAQAGVQQSIAVTTGMMTEALRQTVVNLQREDKMSKKEWIKSVGWAAAGSGIQRYFLGVINAPEYYPARILGDIIYGGGEQSWRILSGQQSDWNWGEYLKSTVIGHFLGEVQGLAFGPSRQQMNILYQHDAAKQYLNGLKEHLAVRHGITGIPDKELWAPSLKMLVGEKNFNLPKTGRFYTSSERQKVIEDMGRVVAQNFTMELASKNSKYYEAGRDTTAKFIAEQRKFYKNEVLSKIVGMKQEDIEKVGDNIYDKDKFKSFLKEHNYFFEDVERDKTLYEMTLDEYEQVIYGFGTDNVIGDRVTKKWGLPKISEGDLSDYGRQSIILDMNRFPDADRILQEKYDVYQKLLDIYAKKYGEKYPEVADLLKDLKLRRYGFKEWKDHIVERNTKAMRNPLGNIHRRPLTVLGLHGTYFPDNSIGISPFLRYTHGIATMRHEIEHALDRALHPGFVSRPYKHRPVRPGESRADYYRDIKQKHFFNYSDNFDVDYPRRSTVKEYYKKGYVVPDAILEELNIPKVNIKANWIADLFTQREYLNALKKFEHGAMTEDDLVDYFQDRIKGLTGKDFDNILIRKGNKVQEATLNEYLKRIAEPTPLRNNLLKILDKYINANIGRLRSSVPPGVPFGADEVISRAQIKMWNLSENKIAELLGESVEQPDKKTFKVRTKKDLTKISMSYTSKLAGNILHPRISDIATIKEREGVPGYIVTPNKSYFVKDYPTEYYSVTKIEEALSYIEKDFKQYGKFFKGELPNSIPDDKIGLFVHHFRGQMYSAAGVLSRKTIPKEQLKMWTERLEEIYGDKKVAKEYAELYLAPLPDRDIEGLQISQRHISKESPVYNAYTKFADESKSNLKKAIAYYLHNERGIPQKDIAEFLGLSPRTVSVYVYDKSPVGFKKEFIEWLIGRKLTPETFKVKSKEFALTDRDIENFIDNVNITTRDFVNPVTGIRSVIINRDIDKIIYNNGYLLSFKEDYDIVRNVFGERAANDLIIRISQMIMDESNRYNTETSKKSGIEIINPKDSPFDFLITGKYKELNEKFINNMIAILKNNNYEETKFAIVVNSEDGTKKHIVHGFDNLAAIKLHAVYDIDHMDTYRDEVFGLMRVAKYMSDQSSTMGLKRAIFSDKEIDIIEKEIKPLIENMKSDDAVMKWLREHPEDINTIENILKKLYDRTEEQTNEVIYREIQTSLEQDIQKPEYTIKDNGESLLSQMISQEKEFLELAPIFKGLNYLKKAEEIPTKLKEIKDKFENKFNILSAIERATTIWGRHDTEKQSRMMVQAVNKIANTFNRAGVSADVLFKALMVDFKTKYKGTDGNIAFDKFMQLIWEVEKNKILTINPDVIDNGKFSIVKKEGFNVDKYIDYIKENPNSINQKMVVTLKDLLHDKDNKIPLTKFLCQTFNIKGKDFIDIVRKLDFNFYNPFTDYLKFNEDVNLDAFVAYKDNINKKVIKIAQLDLTKITEKEAYSLLNKNFKQDGKKYGKIKRALDSYYKIDPKQYSWIHHSIIGKNTRTFYNVLNEFINTGIPRGREVSAGSFMKAFFIDRKFPTIEATIKAGFRIEESFYNNLYSTMKYAFSRVMNFEIARQLKLQFLEQWARNLANGTDAEFIKEYVGGLIYVPTGEHINGLKKKIENMEAYITAAEDRTDITANEIVRLNAVLSDYKYELSLSEGFRKWITEKKSIKVTDEKTGKEKSQKFDFGKQRQNDILGGQSWIPAHWDSYLHDAGNIKTLSAGINMISKANGSRAAYLSGWEGLYFHEDLWRGMTNIVFRDDAIKRNYNYGWQRYLDHYYTKFNTNLKMIRFYKPTIMAFNDIIQLSLMNPASLRHIPKAIKIFKNRYAVENPADPTSKPTSEAIAYKWMEDNDLFNNSVGWRGEFYKQSQSIAEMFDKPTISRLIFGSDNRTIKNFFKGMVGGTKRSWHWWQGVTWNMDKILRIAGCIGEYERFKGCYSDGEAKYMAAHRTNLFLVNYSRLPIKTRRALNKCFLVGNYRIGTLRMYGNMITSFARGIKRALGGKIPDDMYTISDNKWRQAMFEMAPLARWVLYQGIAKGLLGTLFGFSHESIFDIMTSYRVKKRKKEEHPLDSEMQYLSLGTPLFDLHKHFTRLRRAPYVWLKYNMAAFPGLILSMVQNENIVTGKPVVTVDWEKQPRKALAQFGANLLASYFPLGAEYVNMTTENLEMTKKIINLFGVGYFYNTKNPRQLLREFERSIDQSVSLKDREKAVKNFRYAFRRAYRSLFERKYKDISEQLRELEETVGESTGGI